MDESWRMRMGAPTRTKTRQSLPPRRSTEETSARRAAVYGGESETLAAEDFSDVFGGPPRTVLSRQFSAGDFTRSPANPFYEEIFRQPDAAAPSRRTGRNLPEFRIPGSRERSEGFYSDIFGIGKEEDGVWRSRSKTKSKSKSKSDSSSVLSSEELSPRRPAAAGDEASFSSFASKLRPINVPCRWNSSTTMPYHEHSSQPAFPYNQPSHYDNRFPENEYNDNFRSPHFGFPQRVPSPETISLNPNSYRSIKTPMDDLELNSPSSVVSSLCQDVEAKASKIQDKGYREEEMEQEEDEVISSYVIEINVDNREATDEALSVDEAIAWAKEKFYMRSDDKSWSKRGKDQSSEAQGGFSDGQMDGNGPMGCSVEEEEEETNVCAPEDEEQMEKHMEMELPETEIMSWSAGKESNIRLLLSTLHHILWPNSGWYAIPLTNLVENSQVKRAYQKARLCLHPDKLQQRGATMKQKCVAEKAFSVLQEAWAAYISQDVFYS
ncbi:uncharacterized protein LOC131314867 isoform X6 [Rhododendron vialii]|uniref:uncharacterized protein LOC131314867 isoform X6 n=1 Tax=Rhododendron vialii TaxID=182163 RepID=UPI00265F77C6|nr:uncharacterized protein LOC131314867 isoform X6 [Rhododendron vialii]